MTKKPIKISDTSKFVESLMKNHNWTLVESIEQLEAAYPFHDQYDVLAQYINYRYYFRAIIFFLSRTLRKKGRISWWDCKTIMRRLG